MNRKIVLFGALTLCITTVSLATKRDIEQNNTKRKTYSIKSMKKIGDQMSEQLSAQDQKATILAVKTILTNLDLRGIIKQHGAT